MKTFLLIIAGLAASNVHAQWVVSAPGMEARQDQKNVFDTLKYAWEQAQWADKLATLHDSLTTVREQLETANMVKQAIGDPVAAVGLIDSGLISGYFQESGVGDTLGELINIAGEGASMSSTIGQLFEPIDLSRWTNLSDSVAYFDGTSSFRDPNDPLRRFRAVESAYSRFETLLGRAQNKRRLLNQQIAQLTTQLKNAQSDAEVQKLAGSLSTAQTALEDLDGLTDTAHHQVESLQMLNENRKQAEEVAAEEISRQRNRELARLAAEADAQVDLPDFTSPNADLPPGF